MDDGGNRKNWFATLEKRFLPSYVWQKDQLTLWRERILFVICFIAATFGFFALIPSTILAYMEGLWGVLVLDLVAYIMAVVILLGRNTPFKIRSWLAYFFFYILGTGLLFMLGNIGAGYIWLFGSSVMAGALIGLRPAVYALILNFLALVAVAVFISVGQPEWAAVIDNPIQKWVVMTVNFMLLNTLVTVTTSLMLNGLQNALSKSEDLGENLRQSEQRLRIAFQTSPDAITINRLSDAIYINANEGFTKLSGYTHKEIIGHSTLEMGIWHDKAERKHFLSELKTKGIVNNMEARFRRKDGKIINALVSASLLDYQGEPHILSLTRDITALKETQRQLQQAQKMEAVGILAGGIAHDFNNLLQAIGGYAQLLIFDKKQDDPEYKDLEAINKAVRNAAQLVRQLLTFSRKNEYEPIILDLNHEIEGVKKILSRTLPKMIEIKLQLDQELLPVKADPLQIEQALLNLGTNAADAMPDGGQLLISTEKITLRDEYVENHLGARPGEYSLLTVSDTGSGIAPETVRHIFEPFYTTKEIGKGTGLGLASVYGIVKKHGGYIMCYSELDQGTSFKIYFPAAETNELDQKKQDVVQPIEGGRETILLVDDDQYIRDFASQLLRNFGYTVLSATSGEEALAIFTTRPKEIDLVLLDIGMPGMGGHKCLRDLLEIDPTARVLLASGYALQGQVKETLEAGAAGYIGKPYQAIDLLKKIRIVLDGKNGRAG